MTYRIDRSALHAFLDEQIARIEATPLPTDIRRIAPATEISDDDLGGVWLGAGLATQVGIVLLESPERFIEEATEPDRRC